MADDVAADMELAEAGQLPDQGPAPQPDTSQTDKALDAVAKAFEQAEQGRANEPTSDRPRDEAGRFAKAQAEKAAAEAKAAPDASKPTDPQQPQAPAVDGDTPGAWKGKPDRAAVWAKLDPEARKAINDREAEVNAGFKMYEGLGPYVRQAEANGTTLRAAVDDYWKIEQGLRSDFGQGIRAICQRMGVDPMRLGAYLTGQQAAGGPVEGAQPLPAPHVAQPVGLTADDVVRIVDQRTVAATRQQEITAFFDNPANKHANDVAPQMAAIIREKVARNEPVDLKAVYDEALYSNPTTRANLLNEERARWEKERVEKETAAAQKARRLGASVRPSAGPTQRPNGKMTAEQAAAAAWEDAQA